MTELLNLLQQPQCLINNEENIAIKITQQKDDMYGELIKQIIFLSAFEKSSEIYDKIYNIILTKDVRYNIIMKSIESIEQLSCYKSIFLADKILNTMYKYEKNLKKHYPIQSLSYDFNNLTL